MILSTAQAPCLRAMFPQKLFQFLCTKVMRYCCQVYDTDWAARGQTPAFIKDLGASILALGQPSFRRGHHQQKGRLPVPWPKGIFKLSNAPGDCFHGLSSVARFTARFQ